MVGSYFSKCQQMALYEVLSLDTALLWHLAIRMCHMFKGHSTEDFEKTKHLKIQLLLHMHGLMA